jgi:MFS family permease
MARDQVGGRRASGLVVLQSVATATFSVLPPFLVGALGVSLREEFGFGPEFLGFSVAWFFIVVALSAPRLGGVVERLGIRASFALGGLSTGLTLLGVGLAPNPPLILAALTVGGIANAIVQPAVNAALSARIPGGHLGLAIGIKQSSIPAATLLGGFAVPTLAVAVGWRWTFVVAAILSAVNGLVAWRTQVDPVRPAAAQRPRRRPVNSLPHHHSLLILTGGAFLAAAAATTLGAFQVDGGVAVGLTESRAGFVFAGSSAFGLLTRVIVGWLADRHPTRSRYGAIIALLLVGAPGFLLLSASHPTAFVLGAFLAYGAAWGWPGLFHYSVVSQYPATPAAATGVLQSGVAAGAGLGPLAFGLVAGRASYETAWLSAGALCLVAAGLFLIGRAQLRRSLRATVRTSGTPAMPPRDEWEGTPHRTLRDGVETWDVTAPDGETTLIRLAPGRSWTARASYAPSVVVAVLEGESIDLRIGSLPRSARPGDAYELPTSLLWTVENLGGLPATIAVQPRHGG